MSSCLHESPFHTLALKPRTFGLAQPSLHARFGLFFIIFDTVGRFKVLYYHRLIAFFLFFYSDLSSANSSYVVLKKSISGPKCGGVIVADRVIMTHKSCITGRFPVFAKSLATGKSSELSFLSASHKFDAIVLMRSNEMLGSIAQIGTSPSVGDVVSLISAEKSKFHSGEITKFKKIDGLSSKGESLGLMTMKIRNNVAEYKSKTSSLLGSPVYNNKNQLIGIVQKGSKEGSFLSIESARLQVNPKKKTIKNEDLMTQRPHLLGIVFFPTAEAIKFNNEDKFSLDAGLGLKLVYNDHYSLSTATTLINKYRAFHFGYSNSFGMSHFDDEPWLWNIKLGRRTYTNSSKYSGTEFNEIEFSIGKGWLKFGLVLLSGKRKATGLKIL